MNAASRKKGLRERFRSRVSPLGRSRRASASRLIVSRLKKVPAFRNAASLLFYWPKEGEPDLRPEARRALRARKCVCLPRIQRGRLVPVRIRNLARDLEPGPFGLRVPRRSLKRARCAVVDVALIPGLAFDLRKYRLGRGKAFFDRFLARHPEVFKIGVAFASQLIRRLPVSPHDVPMDIIITDKRLIR